MRSPDKTVEFHAAPEDVGKRLDQFVVSKLDDVSRARVQQLIERDKIEVNGKPEKASYRMQGNELVRLLAPATARPLNAEPENIPLDIVFEDDSIAVVNKPAGMMVHAGAGRHAQNDDDEGGGGDNDKAVAKDPRTHGTLVNALLYRFKELSKEGGDLRPGIVHRLDKDTSGLIIVAKTDRAHRNLAEQFSGRTLKKKYVALVHGWPKTDHGTINEPVGRDRSHRHRMSTRGIAARDAISHYSVVKRITSSYGKFALLEVTIETGRTHQIRVHLASIGYPVVGDTLYGAPREIAPLPGTFTRAKRPGNTKATRDRATSDLARLLTLEATEETVSASKPSAAKSRKKSGSGRIADQKDARKASDKRPLTGTGHRSQSPQDSDLPPAPMSLSRNFLHASAIEFTHPATGKPIQLERQLPPDLDAFLRALSHLK